MDKKLIKLLHSKEICFGNIYRCNSLWPYNCSLIQENVILVKLSKNYYYMIEKEIGFWDHAIEKNEFYVDDIKKYLDISEGKLSLKLNRKRVQK